MRPEDQIRAAVTDCLTRRLEDLQLPATCLADDFDLVANGVLDSFAFVEIITMVTDRLGIRVDVSAMDPDDFTTMGGIVESFKQALDAK